MMTSRLFRLGLRSFDGRAGQHMFVHGVDGDQEPGKAPEKFVPTTTGADTMIAELVAASNQAAGSRFHSVLSSDLFWAEILSDKAISDAFTMHRKNVNSMAIFAKVAVQLKELVTNIGSDTPDITI